MHRYIYLKAFEHIFRYTYLKAFEHIFMYLHTQHPEDSGIVSLDGTGGFINYVWVGGSMFYHIVALKLSLVGLSA